MDDVVIASNGADASAAAGRRAAPRPAAGALGAARRGAAGRGRPTATSAAATPPARRPGRLVRARSWCRTPLAEEKAMYPAAHAMRRRPAARRRHARRAPGDRRPGRGARGRGRAGAAAAAARALQVVFESHLAKENELVLPLLVGGPGVSVAGLLGGMHELLGGRARRRPPPRRPRGAGTTAPAARRTARATPSSTPATCRTRSGTPPSSARWTPCSRAAAWCSSPRTTRCRCWRRSSSASPGVFDGGLPSSAAPRPGASRSSVVPA